MNMKPFFPKLHNFRIWKCSDGISHLIYYNRANNRCSYRQLVIFHGRGMVAYGSPWVWLDAFSHPIKTVPVWLEVVRK